MKMKSLIAGGSALALSLGSSVAAMPASTAISGIDPSTYITAAVVVVGAVLSGLIGIKLIKKFANRAS